MTRRQFWDRYLRTYDALTMVGDYRTYLDKIADRLCARPGLRILDAGSGTGNLSIRMRDRGARVVSLDLSPVALAVHKRKDPSAVQVETSLESPLPFPDGAFDGVACTSVLFAFSEAGVQTALTEFKRVLKQGGRLLVTVRNKDRSRLRFGWHLLLSSLRARGSSNLIWDVCHRLGLMIHMLLNSIRMYSLRRQEGYRRLSRTILLSKIADAGFSQLCTESVFGDQFHMVEAVSPCLLSSVGVQAAEDSGQAQLSAQRSRT